MTWLVVAFADVPVAPLPELFPSFTRAAGALVVVLALLFGVAWLLKRGAPARTGRKGLAIESALALGERRSLAIVSIEGRRLLVGLAPGHVSLVTELAPLPEFGAVMDAAVSSVPAAPGGRS